MGVYLVVQVGVESANEDEGMKKNKVRGEGTASSVVDDSSN